MRNRPTKKSLVLILLVLMAALILWGMCGPSSSESRTKLASWQALEKEGRIWLLVETERITPRSGLTSPRYSRESLAQYLFVISPQGVEQRFEFPKGLVWTLHPVFSQIIGTPENVLLAHLREDHAVELLVWKERQFVRVEQGERGKLLEEMDLLENSLRAGGEDEANSISKKSGWHVLTREHIALEEGFDGLDQRVRIVRQKDGSHENLIATGSDSVNWTSLLVRVGKDE